MKSTYLSAILTVTIATLGIGGLFVMSKNNIIKPEPKITMVQTNHGTIALKEDETLVPSGCHYALYRKVKKEDLKKERAAWKKARENMDRTRSINKQKVAETSK